MAGKVNKGKNRKAYQDAKIHSETSIPSDVPIKADSSLPEVSEGDANDNVAKSEQVDFKDDEIQSDNDNPEAQEEQGEVQLYPVSLMTQDGEKLELQLNPGDSVIDVRQFIHDSPETCFFTCYDLLLHTKDGSVHQLEDYNEISDVADITTGDCSMEIVAALYDDRSIRAHVNHTRDLLSIPTLHSSLSTSLASQYKVGKNATTNSDSSKIEVPELDNLGFMEDVTGSLTTLLSSSSKEIKSIESIVFSSFNPPPSYRRLIGDLIYLDVVTLEGNKFCITGTTKVFYVNSSTGNIFDPKPSKSVPESVILVGLLQNISSKFKKAFHEILERKASAHPFENVQSILPPNSWLGMYPLPECKRDAARAETAITLTFGSELIGMQRDWNEELQSCKEFPQSTPQERIVRDRALYKVSSDFVEAAINGTTGVINRCIPPINPTDPECFHMYVHNNIFFSFAVDADLEQLSKMRSNSNSNTSSINNASESFSKPSSASVPVSNVDKPDVSNAVDANNVTDIDSNGVIEPQLAENEQATYASTNNDLKGTKAYQEAEVPGIYNLAMAIIDFRGHRVIAQSVLPGILHGDKSNSLLYGSVDNGKKIYWNEDFHLKVVEAAKRLHLKEHTVCDGSGNDFKLAAPVECKGIVGSDGRYYLLDLMRVTPRDANYTGQGSRFCILRPELISAYCQAEAAVSSKILKQVKEPSEASALTEHEHISEEQVGVDEATLTSSLQDMPQEAEDEAVQECDSANEANQEIFEDICFNPNVLTDFKLSGNEEENAEDEENVIKASSYLRDVVIPKFIKDLCTLEVSPFDGQTLTDAFHAHGINIRYIGKVTEGIKHLPHLLDLFSNEIVVRSAKHFVKDLLRETADDDVAPALSHFFNCLFGNYQAPALKGGSGPLHSKSQKKENATHQASGKLMNGRTGRLSKKQSSYLSMTSDSLWVNIVEFAKLKYQFELPEDAKSQAKKIIVIRNFCQKVGITIAAHNYDLNTATPFQTSDVLNLQPVVKHSIPVCSEAKELVELGKLQLNKGYLADAYASFSEASTILQQVSGPMHHEVANCCRFLAMVLHLAGDTAGALMQQHNELIINERCLGLDHPDTAHSYCNMALLYHGLNQTELALRHLHRALLLQNLSSGSDHPEIATTFINVATIYQDIEKMNTALRYIQEAIKKNEILLGEDHIRTALCYHALAIAFNCMGAYKLSLQHEKKANNIFCRQLGADDAKTRESLNWMVSFKILEMNNGRQKDLSRHKANEIFKDHPNLMKAIQAAIAADDPSWNSGKSISTSMASKILSPTLQGPRGVDQRGVAAAAALRKKAAANHQSLLPPRPPIRPPQRPVSPINHANAPDNGSLENRNEQLLQGPDGLGTGLTPLNAKKGKAKAKAKTTT